MSELFPVEHSATHQSFIWKWNDNKIRPNSSGFVHPYDSFACRRYELYEHSTNPSIWHYQFILIMQVCYMSSYKHMDRCYCSLGCSQCNFLCTYASYHLPGIQTDYAYIFTWKQGFITGSTHPWPFVFVYSCILLWHYEHGVLWNMQIPTATQGFVLVLTGTPNIGNDTNIPLYAVL